MIDITSDSALAQLCSRMAGQPYIAMDTEFIRERTYFPILALVQVSWPGQEPVLIDPLEIQDWEPFHEVLRNPDICKVFHAGRQDLEIFFHQMGGLPRNIYDTQIAASMCGYGEQVGYGVLVAKLLGVQLTKGSSYTNWLQRPLTDAQTSYARDDVLYLGQVYEALVEQATRQGRMTWIQAEIDDQLNEAIFEPDPQELWRRVKKSKSLKDRDTPVLQSLAAWRDDQARSLNKPPRFLISDDALIELARLDRLTPQNLKSRRGLGPGILDRFGESLRDVHQAGRDKPKSEWPHDREKRRRPPSDAAEALADLAWLLLKEISAQADMAPTHLIPKKNLAYFVDDFLRGKSLDAYPISSGWRKAMVGDLLTDLLDGRLVIEVVDRKILWRERES